MNYRFITFAIVLTCAGFAITRADSRGLQRSSDPDKLRVALNGSGQSIWAMHNGNAGQSRMQERAAGPLAPTDSIRAELKEEPLIYSEAIRGEVLTDAVGSYYILECGPNTTVFMLYRRGNGSAAFRKTAIAYPKLPQRSDEWDCYTASGEPYATIVPGMNYTSSTRLAIAIGIRIQEVPESRRGLLMLNVDTLSVEWWTAYGPSSQIYIAPCPHSAGSCPMHYVGAPFVQAKTLTTFVGTLQTIDAWYPPVGRPRAVGPGLVRYDRAMAICDGLVVHSAYVPANLRGRGSTDAAADTSDSGAESSVPSYAIGAESSVPSCYLFNGTERCPETVAIDRFTGELVWTYPASLLGSAGISCLGTAIAMSVTQKTQDFDEHNTMILAGTSVRATRGSEPAFAVQEVLEGHGIWDDPTISHHDDDVWFSGLVDTVPLINRVCSPEFAPGAPDAKDSCTLYVSVLIDRVVLVGMSGPDFKPLVLTCTLEPAGESSGSGDMPRLSAPSYRELRGVPRNLHILVRDVVQTPHGVVFAIVDGYLYGARLWSIVALRPLQGIEGAIFDRVGLGSKLPVVDVEVLIPPTYLWHSGLSLSETELLVTQKGNSTSNPWGARGVTVKAFRRGLYPIQPASPSPSTSPSAVPSPSPTASTSPTPTPSPTPASTPTPTSTPNHKPRRPGVDAKAIAGGAAAGVLVILSVAFGVVAWNRWPLCRRAAGRVLQQLWCCCEDDGHATALGYQRIDSSDDEGDQMRMNDGSGDAGIAGAARDSSGEKAPLLEAGRNNAGTWGAAAVGSLNFTEG